MTASPYITLGPKHKNYSDHWKGLVSGPIIRDRDQSIAFSNTLVYDDQSCGTSQYFGL